LREDGGWIDATTGQPPTATDFKAVLATLRQLQIRGEYQRGPDVDGLDSVVLGDDLQAVYLPQVAH